MKKIILLLLLSKTITVYSQSIKEFVSQQTQTITTILPDSDDYSDLEPVGKAIGNARIVMLGEQDHGDAPTFLAKTRLIKYLHEKKGFTVLAFESDFFALNEGWDPLIKRKEYMDSFLLKNIPGVWAFCSTTDNLLFHYIPATQGTPLPLKVTGFDSQQFMDYSYQHLVPELDSVLRNLHLPITQESGYTSQVLPLIRSSIFWTSRAPKDTSDFSTCLGYLTIIRSQLQAISEKSNFWSLVVDNLYEEVSTCQLEAKTKNYPLGPRDIQMAKNLSWLSGMKFKTEKIIVWAANAHIAKSLQNIKSDYFAGQETMGNYFVSNLTNKDDCYVLGFASYTGEWGRVGRKSYKIPAPRKNSFETWIRQDVDYAFINFKDYNNAYPDRQDSFFMSGLGHVSNEGKWNSIFDGVFFIRNISACTSR